MINVVRGVELKKAQAKEWKEREKKTGKEI